MLKLIQKNLFLILIVIFGLFFFNKTLTSGLLPIPSDNIVGLYYPFRDNYAKTNPNGLPYKNFLLTDPVRQTYPWKNLVISSINKLQIPLWNPYNFSGTPLLANFQSSVFYPLNILLFVLPFSIGWSFLIILQPLMAGIFIYLFLRNLILRKEASFLGALTFSFCGFSIAWLEWGNIINTALWLPLILLSIDKISTENKRLLNKWNFIFVLSLTFSFFAGHLQTFFYIFTFSFVYILFRVWDKKNNLKKCYSFILLYIIFIIITFIQWYPTLQLILLSARDADLISYNTAGWFIPWQNIVQFIAPDFFGNTSTLNYFGEWNYGEFIGYVGIIPLIFAVFGIVFKRSRETILFTALLILTIIFAFPNPISKIPYVLNLPFISTAQPTRLIYLADFALAILAAFGFNEYLNKGKKIVYILPFFVLIFILMWGFVIGNGFGFENAEHLLITKQNIKLPTVLFIVSAILLLLPQIKFIKKDKRVMGIFISLVILLSVFDLFRFGWKFEPFTNKKYLFPETKVLSYLQNNSGQYRVIATDSRIFPPNFSIMYDVFSPDGYDPLYIKRYGELMAAYARNKPDISPPLGFNRIITLQNPDSPIIDLLGIKYVLSLEDQKVSKLSKVYSNGSVNVYQNNSVLERVFFVPSTKFVTSKQESIDAMFDINYTYDKRAVVEGVKPQGYSSSWDIGKINIDSYTANKIRIKTNNNGNGFMVLTDAYYPTWRATIDGKKTEIYITDYAFRGIIVPKGKHVIEFTNHLL